MIKILFNNKSYNLHRKSQNKVQEYETYDQISKIFTIKVNLDRDILLYQVTILC